MTTRKRKSRVPDATHPILLPNCASFRVVELSAPDASSKFSLAPNHAYVTIEAANVNVDQMRSTMGRDNKIAKSLSVLTIFSAFAKKSNCRGERERKAVRHVDKPYDDCNFQTSPRFVLVLPDIQ